MTTLSEMRLDVLEHKVKELEQSVEELRAEIIEAIGEIGADVGRLEGRLDAVVDVVEKIVYARWCEGKDTSEAEKRVLGGLLGKCECTVESRRRAD